MGFSSCLVRTETGKLQEYHVGYFWPQKTWVPRPLWKWHPNCFLYVPPRSKSLCANQYFIQLKPLLMLDEGLWHTVKGKMFSQCLELFPKGENLFATPHWRRKLFFPTNLGYKFSKRSKLCAVRRLLLVSKSKKVPVSILGQAGGCLCWVCNIIDGWEVFLLWIHHSHNATLRVPEGQQQPGWQTERWGCSLLKANHVDYCDYRPFPLPVSCCNLLTWIWQKKKSQ